MKALIFAWIALSTSASFAENVTCTLASENQKSVAITNLESQLGEYVVADSPFDLSFNQLVECEESTCDVYITIDSSLAEDEVGSFGFQFERKSKSFEFFREPIESAPDGKLYEFFCAYNR
jgi:hypothetical protein